MPLWYLVTATPHHCLCCFRVPISFQMPLCLRSALCYFLCPLCFTLGSVSLFKCVLTLFHHPDSRGFAFDFTPVTLPRSQLSAVLFVTAFSFRILLFCPSSSSGPFTLLEKDSSFSLLGTLCEPREKLHQF